MEHPIIAENQQVSLCELSWLGGVLDAIGYFSVEKKSRKNNKWVHPVVKILTENEIIANRTSDILKKYKIPCFIKQYQPTKNWAKKTEIAIVGYKKVQKAIQFIKPFIAAKLEEVLSLERLCSSRIKNPGNYTEQEKEWCKKIWTLNKQNTRHW